MKTIVFLNIKGGVAKTASVTSVAHMMVTLHNKKYWLLIWMPKLMLHQCIVQWITIMKKELNVS